MELIKNRGRGLPAILVAFVLMLVGLLGLTRTSQAQDPGIALPPSWANASVATPSASTVIAATATQRYNIKAIVITDTSSESVTLLDGATAVFKVGLVANTPLVLSETFFGPTGYTPAAVNTAFKMTAAAGTVTVSVRYLLQ